MEENEIIILKCTIETIGKTIYFDILFKGIELNYLSLKVNPAGNACIEMPRFYSPCLERTITFYNFHEFEDLQEVEKVLLEYVKNNPAIFDIIYKKYIHDQT